MRKTLAAISALTFIICGCVRNNGSAPERHEGSVLFSIDTSRNCSTIRTFHPDGTMSDSISISGSMSRIICMSSSYVAFLSALGCDSVICGVSGGRYISEPGARARITDGRIAEVGSDAAPDYEKIMSLEPDLVVAYEMPGSDFITNLRSLGIKVLALSDYLENSPLGRASYIKVFGALTGRLDTADSLFNVIAEKYDALADKVNADVSGGAKRIKVLMNIPYADAWYIPGGDNYMSRMIQDAGGEILGAVPGETESSIVPVETAYSLSRDADVWLNTGWCDTREQLYSSNALFSSFRIGKIYNNTRRMTECGGNDFWESGAVRPDLILQDLVSILHPEIISSGDTGLYYYKEVTE